MEQIKKKLASLKQEKDDAIDRAEEAERLRKEAEAKVEAVSPQRDLCKAHWF